MLLNVLILGGNGYLGSKVTRQLIKAGNCVVCTKRQSSDLSRLSDLEKSINWIPASIDSVDTATKYTPFDYVLNMACNYGRENVLYDNVLDANIEFTLKVLNKTVNEWGDQKMANWKNETEAREQIKALVAKYYHDFKEPTESKDNFRPGDRISYASRVYDEKEMQSLTDAMLDFWLTTGRFADEFEKQFAA